MENEKVYEHFRALRGLQVQVNLGGPESREGRLLDVRSDYLALDTDNEGVLYYQLRHIKSMTKFSKKTSRDHGRARYYKYNNFNDLLKRLRFKWVKINRGGPQSVEGTITHVQDGNILLIVNDQILYIPIFHVQSINHPGDSKRSAGNKSSGKKSGKKSGDQSDGGSGHKSDGRQSGHRSGGSSGQQSGHRSGRQSGHQSGRISGTDARNMSGIRSAVKSGKRNGRNSGLTTHGKGSDVHQAYEIAQEQAIEHFMHNDPEEDGGRSRGSASMRSKCSHRSMGSGPMRSDDTMISGRSKSSHHHHSKHSGKASGTNNPNKVWISKQFPKS
ncbi:MAG TPA: hypothetical protein VFT51_05275 [Bacillales bacterium]|nr:hypothetical protein [Bacillales bacterium]